jgi:2,4-dienoyl-CoA reductase-like NADH-dependent reductase (Old Yellow Enzyme family)
MRWTPGDNEVYVELLRRVRDLALAYVHTGVVEDRVYEELGCTSTQFLRRHWGGVLVANGAYVPARAQQAVASGACDLVSFGRSFIANPDLVERLRQGQPLVEYRPEMTKALQ